MSMINYASREINCKIVYYGSGLGGKTTNLEHIYGKVQPDTRGKLISLATETERTLFFDFLPVDLGTIRGFKTRFHLYTVPGQVYYNASRKLILKGVDGIVFVADSQTERMEANQEAMQNLYDNMAEYGYDLTKMPFVIQYNKRDLPNAAPVRELQAALNPGWEITEPARQRVTPDAYHAGENLVEQLPSGEWIERATYFEAVAVTGDGVFETLRASIHSPTSCSSSGRSSRCSSSCGPPCTSRSRSRHACSRTSSRSTRRWVRSRSPGGCSPSCSGASCS
jgi:signal recognition particle receptor subunit beta